MQSRYSYRIELNRDEDGNPISILQAPEQSVVLQGKIQLGQIPDKVYKVKIKDLNEIPDTDYETTINESSYRVDYSNGLVTFHESMEGKTVIIEEYYGKGIILFPYNRIWMEDDEFGNVTKTLNDYVDEANNLMNLVTGLDELTEDGNQLYDVLEVENKKAVTNINEAKSSNANLGKTISDANTANSNLTATNKTATTTDSTLKETTLKADTANTKLNSSISSGTTLNNGLASNITTGTTLKSNLDKDILDGNSLHTTLSGDISTGTSKLSEINAKIDESTRLNVFEAYDNTKQYYPLNKVYYGGSSYVCIKASKGVLPSVATNWGLIAQAGSGNVSSVTSANGDIKVELPTSTPKLTLNAGSGANQILRLDSNGKVPSGVVDYKADKSYVDVELDKKVSIAKKKQLYGTSGVIGGLGSSLSIYSGEGKSEHIERYHNDIEHLYLAGGHSVVLESNADNTLTPNTAIFDNTGKFKINGKEVYHEGNFNSGNFLRRINLSGQMQKKSYVKSVIALCSLDNTITFAYSFSCGILCFNRGNGLMGVSPIKLNFSIQKSYNTELPIINYELIGHKAEIKPCKFKYNDKWYGGFHFYCSNAVHDNIYYNGETNFNIFGIDYFDKESKIALVGEINDSIVFEDFYYGNYIGYNGKELYHEGNFNPNTKADKEHSHDDRYYTESEIDSKLSTKADKTYVDTNIATKQKKLVKTTHTIATKDFALIDNVYTVNITDTNATVNTFVNLLFSSTDILNKVVSGTSTVESNAGYVALKMLKLPTEDITVTLIFSEVS